MTRSHAPHLLALTCCVALSACAIQQTVRPLQPTSEQEICIIENKAVKPGFLEAYRRALVTQGYRPRQLPATAATGDCPVTSVYSARWRWDLALYMSFAEITVYRDGKVAGEAKYDSEGGSASMSKFIDADRKVTELVAELFPRVAAK